MQAVENLLAMMTSVVQRHKKQLQLRSICCGERVWKSQLNYSVAQAHLALLYQGLDQLHGGALQQRCSRDFTSPLLDFSRISACMLIIVCPVYLFQLQPVKSLVFLSGLLWRSGAEEPTGTDIHQM